MSAFFKSLLSSRFVISAAQALARHFLTGAGVALAAFLVAHHADAGLAQQMVDYLIGAAVSAVGVALSMLDVKKVGTKMQTSADAGAAVVQQAVAQAAQQGEDVQRAADQARADAVKTAITVADTKAKNATVDDVLAQMRAGGA